MKNIFWTICVIWQNVSPPFSPYCLVTTPCMDTIVYN